MSKNRARKGRGWELPGPDWQLQSASSSPAWQGDRRSRGCDGPPCASGGCRSNLAGKTREPSRGCWRFDKKQQLCEEICTNQESGNVDAVMDTAQTWGGTAAWQHLLLSLLHLHPSSLHTLLCGASCAPRESPELLLSAGTRGQASREDFPSPLPL